MRKTFLSDFGQKLEDEANFMAFGLEGDLNV